MKRELSGQRPSVEQARGRAIGQFPSFVSGRGDPASAASLSRWTAPPRSLLRIGELPLRSSRRGIVASAGLLRDRRSGPQVGV